MIKNIIFLPTPSKSLIGPYASDPLPHSANEVEVNHPGRPTRQLTCYYRWGRENYPVSCNNIEVIFWDVGFTETTEKEAMWHVSGRH